MPVTVKDMIERLDYDDLLKIKKDLDDGGIHMNRLVKEKIKQHLLMHRRICVVCQNEIEPYSTNNYTLLFGPEDFKKKATFCALDCLQYFLNQMKEKKEGMKIEKETPE
ncbi:hypothetical protein JXA85_01115 [Candidatus Woesearchaeota archaeon]|nr:hypothetical protein [Candidatus Woesearchaeota archaeon]